MSILIIARAIYEGDAVGIDVLQQYRLLKENGFDVYMYAEIASAKLSNAIIQKNQLNDILNNGNNDVIYHHCVFWPQGENIIRAAESRVFMRYHSVTPSSFFEPYCEVESGVAALGEMQTKRLIQSGKIHHYIATSMFTKNDLKRHGAGDGDITVVPPFHTVDDFGNAKPGKRALKETNNGKINVLFVGRLAPNKGHRHLIETVRAYTELYDRDIRLLMVGRIGARLHPYYSELKRMVAYYNLSDLVSFKKGVSFEDLHAYYSSCDLFLVMSEHEGFCVPIIEAQYHRVPVIALDRCAVGDTLGKEQLIFKDPDYITFACAVHSVSHDDKVRQYLVEKGYNNYLKYNLPDLGKQLLALFS
jgi:glycosyltransferase involved in cell wall biosynthesis